MQKDSMLSTNLCGMRLSNPTILASGVFGITRDLLARASKNGAGAVTMKTITKEPRSGHNAPIIVSFESGMLNAVGYANPGIEEVCKEYADLSDVKCPVIGSALGENASEFAYVISKMGKLPVCAIELPLSCPHTPGFGLMSGHTEPKEAAKITKAAKRATKKPIIIKLSPSIPNVGEVASAVEKAGADAINCGNSVGPGMIIDIEARKPVLGFGMGGVHGPAIRPLAVRCVYDIYKSVKIPIMGCGGVTTGRDAIEMIMAGATAVGVGTATYYRGEEALALIAGEMREWMKKHNYKSLDEIHGIAHGKK